ncbi:MAG: glycosyltransferase [Chloroflexi bacterium]|nr:glycosyltransferase [Chloroflexota bacterium]
MRTVPHILVYIENYLAGGTERFTFDLANGLAKSHHKVTLWSNRNPDFGHGVNRLAEDVVFREINILTTEPLYTWLARQSFGRLVAMPIKLIFVLVRYLFFGGNLLLFLFLLARESPDVFHAVNGGYPGAESCQAALIAARLGRRVPRTILTVLGHPFERKIPLAESAVDKLVACAVDRVVFNSWAGVQSMVRLRQFSKEQVTCIHSAPPFNLPSAAAIADQRTRLAADGSQPIIGMVGALEPVKGQRFLIQALAQIRERVPTARLVLVGDGSDRARLEALAGELGLASAITFMGLYTGDMLALTGAFDVVAFSSLREGLPYAILEAMAVTRPIMATCVGGVPEQIEDGVSGLLAPPGDAEALARGLLALLSDPERAAALGRAARARLESEFSVEKMLAAFEQLYHTTEV